MRLPRGVSRGVGASPPAASAARALLAGVLLAAAAACAGETAIDRLRRQLEPFPAYSVVLQDMHEDLFGYAHQYRVMVGEPQAGSDGLTWRESIGEWQEVDSATWNRYLPYLGMVILSKDPDLGLDESPHPPGYAQVGNERYGQWREDANGRSFWEFYGQYALLSHLIGGFGRPIFRDDWNGYRDARTRGAPYHGPGGGVYGTNGSTTRQTHPDFFRRQQQRQTASRQSFGQRVAGRMAGGVRGFGK